MKVLTFDIFADLAHFRKFYTTTSPLSFSFPPPPTVAGILGSIYGTDKRNNQYLKLFNLNHCKIAIQILEPIRKIRMGLNLLETKGKNIKIPMSDKKHLRTQIRTEFIKNPKYRIYIYHQDSNIMDQLCDRVKNHSPFFNVSLGLSQLLANFNFYGLFEAYLSSKNEVVEIITPITIQNLISESLQFEPGKKYFKEKMPILMNPNRVVERYDHVIYEPEGKSILAQVKQYFVLENGTNICFF